MNHGIQIYKDFVDELVEMSRDCAAAMEVRVGNVPLTDMDKIGMNEILDKLDESEREILSKYIIEAYHSGIYDLLDRLVWYHSCRDMVVTVEGEKLPLDAFEGLSNDYVSRRMNLEWME